MRSIVGHPDIVWRGGIGRRFRHFVARRVPVAQRPSVSVVTPRSVGVDPIEQRLPFPPSPLSEHIKFANLPRAHGSQTDIVCSQRGVHLIVPQLERCRIGVVLVEIL